MDGLGRVNLLVGKNNSGKTSVLEALLLLASNNDPSVLWRILARRGEQVISDPVSGRATQSEMDISHLFIGHEIKAGAHLSIKTTNQEPSRSVTYMIDDAKPEESPYLFAQLGQTGEEPTVARLALKIIGPKASSIVPPIPLTKQLAIRPDMFQRLNSPGVMTKVDESGVPTYIATDSLNIGELLQSWNAIVLTPDEDRVIQTLQYLDPNILRIATVQMQLTFPMNTARGGFAVRLKDIDKRIPIGSFGEGMWRLLALAVGLSRAKDNLLLIDEIDTGLHYTVMADMWRIIHKAAIDFNVQVFATTHSYDCVHSLSSICRDIDNSASEVTIHRIETGAKESVKFTEAQIKLAADRDIEIR